MKRNIITAPSFCLQNQNNEQICLKDYKGRWVVLYFYPKDNTAGCTLEAKNFTDSSNKFNHLKASIIGISPDSPESHRQFEEQYQLNIQLLSDSTHNTMEAYDVWKQKKMYGKDFYGVVRSTFLIHPQGTIRHQWSKVKVPGHIEDILTALEKIKKNDYVVS